MTRPKSSAANGATERIREVIAGLGVDKENRPLSIRAPELAQRAGVDIASLYALINPMVRRGEVYACSVKPAVGRPYNEYRKGTGVEAPEFRPLNTRRAGMALGQPGKPLPVTTPAPAVSAPRTVEPATPVFLQPQAQVGKQRQPAAGASTGTPPADPAVTTPGTCRAKTPKPAPGAALKAEPAAEAASAGVVLRLSIDQDGVLQLGDDIDPARFVFTPIQTKQLGHFLHRTHDVWNPF